MQFRKWLFLANWCVLLLLLENEPTLGTSFAMFWLHMSIIIAYTHSLQHSPMEFFSFFPNSYWFLRKNTCKNPVFGHQLRNFRVIGLCEQPLGASLAMFQLHMNMSRYFDHIDLGYFLLFRFCLYMIDGWDEVKGFISLVFGVHQC